LQRKKGTNNRKKGTNNRNDGTSNRNKGTITRNKGTITRKDTGDATLALPSPELDLVYMYLRGKGFVFGLNLIYIFSAFRRQFNARVHDSVVLSRRGQRGHPRVVDGEPLRTMDSAAVPTEIGRN
jgi:hypothetical protein